MTEPGCDWKAPVSRLTLEKEEIQVWRMNLDLPAGMMQRLDRNLSSDERVRAQRFHFEHLRRRFTAGRGSLRAILGNYLNLPPGQLVFTYDAYGKPKLDLQTGESWLTFNLAHSHELALLAVTHSRGIGIDLEYQREIADAEEIAEKYFAREEYEIFRHLPLHEKQAAFFRCWTRKEAFIKAIGEGLSYPLDRFIVSFAPGEPAMLLQIAGSQAAGLEWTVSDLKPGPDYTAALAVKRKPGSAFKLSFWQCTEDLLGEVNSYRQPSSSWQP